MGTALLYARLRVAQSALHVGLSVVAVGPGMLPALACITYTSTVGSQKLGHGCRDPLKTPFRGYYEGPYPAKLEHGYRMTYIGFPSFCGFGLEDGHVLQELT